MKNLTLYFKNPEITVQDSHQASLQASCRNSQSRAEKNKKKQYRDCHIYQEQ